MITTMDKAGRLVVPKAMRVALGLADGGDVQIELDDDGRAVLSAAPVAKHLEGPPGHCVVVPEREIPPLTVEMVRRTLEEIRR